MKINITNHVLTSRCVLFLRTFAKLPKAIISFVMSVRPSAWNVSNPTGRIFIKVYICVFCENLSRSFRSHWNLARTDCTLQEDQYTFIIISRRGILRMNNVSDKPRRKNKNTFYFQIFNSLFFLNRAFYEVMRKNDVEPGRPQITMWWKLIGCWIPTATNT